MHICIWVFVPCYTASMGDILIFLCTNTLSSDVFYSHIFYLCSSFGQGNALIYYFRLSTCGTLVCSLRKLDHFRVVMSPQQVIRASITGSHNCFTLGKGSFCFNASFHASPCRVDCRRLPIISLIDFCRIVSHPLNLSTIPNISNTLLTYFFLHLSSFPLPLCVSLRESSFLSTTLRCRLFQFLTLSQSKARVRSLYLALVIDITFKPNLLISL